MKKLINLEPNFFFKNQKKILQKKFSYNEVDKSRTEIKKIIGKYHIVLSRLKFKFDKDLLKHARNLEVLVTFTTGLTHIDLVEIKKRKIKVVSLKNEKNFLKNIYSSSEFAFLMILAINKNFYQSIHDVKSKKKWRRDFYIGNDLFNKNIGILGFGRIGKKIAKYAKAFGMRVKVFDKNKKNIKKNMLAQSIKDLFLISNIVVIAINYEESNKNLINQENLKYLRKDSYLINIARGEIINEKHLLQFLKRKKIKGAALDVLEDENNINFKKNKLIAFSNKNNNLIISPHIAGATFDSFKKTQEFIVNKLLKLYDAK